MSYQYQCLGIEIKFPAMVGDSRLLHGDQSDCKAHSSSCVLGNKGKAVGVLNLPFISL
jgi:hypothetical protein